MRLGFHTAISHQNGRTILNPGVDIKDWIKLLSGQHESYQVAKMTYGVAIYCLIGLDWKYLLSIRPDACDDRYSAKRIEDIHQLFEKMILV